MDFLKKRDEMNQKVSKFQFHISLATLEPQKYVLARTVPAENSFAAIFNGFFTGLHLFYLWLECQNVTL